MKKLSLFLIFINFTLGCQIEKNGKVKNVILMIGDGMGPQQISLLYYFAKYSKLNIIKPNEFAFEKLANAGSMGMSATEPHGKIVVDSACSATQLATGEMSNNETLGLDFEGNKVATILEKAMKKGMMTGLISDTRSTHATPASFATHLRWRYLEDQIASDYLDVAPHIIFSGGLNRYIPKGTKKQFASHLFAKSKRKDNKNLLNIAKTKNYTIIHSKDDLKNVTKNEKTLGLFTSHNLPDAIWYSKNKDNPNRKIPTLKEMSKAAISKLSQSKKGFFLMIEAGQIDWAGHYNDAGNLLHEMISFNETINYVLSWVKKNPDTLLIVTADHETGSFGLSYTGINIPAPKSLKGKAFKDKPLQLGFNYADFDILDKIYTQKMTLPNLWFEFEKKFSKAKYPTNLINFIFQNTGFKITKKEASDILKRVPNKMYQEGHYLLGVKSLPHINDFSEFYAEELASQTGLIARKLAPRQNIVWGTGGHTATPVHVYSVGPKKFRKKLSNYLTHAQIGKIMQEALGL